MEMRFTPVFWKLYEAAETRPRYISMPGGTRSGKTYSILQFLHLLIPEADQAGDVTSVVSETLPHLKRGAIRDFERIIGHPLKVDPRWNASENVYTYDNGAKLEFFSADAPGKVLGPARKRLFINECNHIEYETARQLFVRTTGLIILDYNPAATFWCIEKIEPRDNCRIIRSTYLDNTFLTPEQVAEIEANRGDANWWKVYGLGELGSLEGVIYTFEQIDAMPERGGLREVYGIDFGFTHDPTAIVRVLADTGRKIAYVQQIAYRRGMLNGDIAAALVAAGVPRGAHVWADAAEPKSIAEIGQQTGLNVLSCDKSAPTRGSRLTFQIQWMQGWKYYVTKDSVDVIKEMRNYTWKKDRDGNLINEPIDIYNHALDSLRYAQFSEFGGMGGIYSFAIAR
jgi:phage terminase large subunit